MSKTPESGDDYGYVGNRIRTRGGKEIDLRAESFGKRFFNQPLAAIAGFGVVAALGYGLMQFTKADSTGMQKGMRMRVILQGAAVAGLVAWGGYQSLKRGLAEKKQSSPQI